MHGIFLSLAAVTEIMAATALKVPDGFTRPIPPLSAIAAFAVSLYFLSIGLRVTPFGIEYAIWSGAGVMPEALFWVFVFS